MTTTLTHDIRVLLAAVEVSPDCDTSRLALADACDESGDSDRAEFIRVQVEISQVGAMDSVRGKLVTLRARESALRDAHSEWLPTCPVIAPDGFSCGGIGAGRPHCEICRGTDRVGTFERGLLTEVRVPRLESVLHRPDVTCPACDGKSDWARPDAWPEGTPGCGECGNHGVVYGDWQPTPWATALLADPWHRAGLRRVAVADRVPDFIGDAPQCCWLRHREGLEDAGAVIGCVYDALKGGARVSAGAEWREHFGAEDEWCIYPTREAADLALATALADVLRGMCGKGG